MARKKKNSKLFSDKVASFLSNKRLVLGLVFLFLFLIFISLISNRMGIVGDAFSNLTFLLIGLGAYYILPLLMIHIIISLTGYSKKIPKKKFVLIYVLVLLSLIIIDLNINNGLSFDARLRNSEILSNMGTGGGYIGMIFSYILGKYIGELGIYILSFIILFLSILTYINLSLKDFFEQIFLIVSRGYAIIKNKLSDNNNSRKRIKANPTDKDGNHIVTTKKIDINSEINTPKKEIKIKNYTDEEEMDKQFSLEDFDVEMSAQNPTYKTPPISLLKDYESDKDNYQNEISRNVEAIESTMESFNISGRIVEVNRGPSITSYELQPERGVKVSSIVSLSDNLALSLASSGIRIEAPIPGKSVVGIEVPNKSMETVSMKEILLSQSFASSQSKMPLALGKDVSGSPVVSSLDRMPHLLIAGATGSGKSVCINTIITSILYKSSPDDVKLILIDPKMVELGVYNGISHLAIPVVTNTKKASAALNWAVKEMERRYELFAEKGVRDIGSYKEKFDSNEYENIPYIVIIIDELSDLMMVSPKEVEDYISRLAQMARACGIHLIIATQRPSVDVITGTIKANIPSRISFSVSSQIDSRTILDMGGAEKLLGKGDMLFYPSNFRTPKRVQGAFISDKEIHDIVGYLKENTETQYNQAIVEEIENTDSNKTDIEDEDDRLSEAIDIVLAEDQASISLLQRKMRIGYARAGRIIDQMAEIGVVGPHEGSKPRKILVNNNVLEDGGDDEYS